MLPSCRPNDKYTTSVDASFAGATHINDGVAQQAKVDLVTAYNNAAGRTPTMIPTELGGSTLKTGTYRATSGTFGVTGTLTLDAEGDPNAVFIFQTGSSLITASNSNIELINGARFCRVFWKVGSSATLGTNSNFVGHIFALTSITANTGAEIQGQLLARNGAVTLDSNTITNGICAPATGTATLTIIKHVINNDGRTAAAGDFQVHLKNNGDDVTASPYAGSESGRTYTVAAGDYVVSEGAHVGYTATFSGDGDSSGNISLETGDEKTITITNNDIAFAPSTTPTETTPGVPSSTSTSTVSGETSNTPTSTVESDTEFTPTVSGGQMPTTATHLYELLLLGFALVSAGTLVWSRRKLYEQS